MGRRCQVRMGGLWFWKARGEDCRNERSVYSKSSSRLSLNQIFKGSSFKSHLNLFRDTQALLRALITCRARLLAHLLRAFLRLPGESDGLGKMRRSAHPLGHAHLRNAPALGLTLDQVKNCQEHKFPNSSRVRWLSNYFCLVTILLPGLLTRVAYRMTLESTCR